MKTHSTTNPVENGQSMVEFSVILIVMLILLAGVVDVGRALFTFMSLRDAAQEGVLFGSLNPTNTSAIEQRVLQTSDLTRDLGDDLTISTTLSGNPCTGNGITVHVLYDSFPISMPFLGAVLGSQSVPISASVTGTILVPPCSGS